MIGNIQNPGSAFGEAIGAEMESALNIFITELVEERGYHYLSKAAVKHSSGKEKKLLMYDTFGTAYNIDAVIANEKLQPIILIESKYIRYKKHNRDKGSWLCTAHPAIRRRYRSIRSSIAILAGNWSSTSLTMMKSFDINIFLIPFKVICDLLREYGIDFDWGEKDRAAAIRAWIMYERLNPEQKSRVGIEMVNLIRDELQDLVLSILDETKEREIKKIEIQLKSNLGEVSVYQFNNIADAIEFLNTAELKNIFIIDDSITLFDPPPEIDDEEDTEDDIE